MTAQLPTISGYGQYSSDNYGLNCLRITIGDLTLWFSYETVVAYYDFTDGKIVSENNWGPTTGKHLNWIDGGGDQARAKRLPRDVFERQLTAAIARN